MANSKDTAEKIMQHLEGRRAGFARTFGSMKRKEANETRDAIASIIDGIDPDVEVEEAE